MYYYIYDSYLAEKKYQPTLAKIETRLTDLGINGKINRLSFLKNINNVIKEETAKGAQTIVVVGNDRTIGQTINIVADLDITLGIIPIGPNNSIGRILGIPEGEKACDVLSARITDNLDLGIVNGNYFLTSLEINSQDASFECDNNYFVSLEGKNNRVYIKNLSFPGQLSAKANDGKLNLVITHEEKRFLTKSKISVSNFTAKEIKVFNQKTVSILLSDENRIVKTPADINIAPKKIKVIVGKGRTY